MAGATITMYVLLAHSTAPHAAANVNKDQIVGIYKTPESCEFALNQFPADDDREKQMFHYCIPGNVVEEPIKAP
jgi:hypothetical protein